MLYAVAQSRQLFQARLLYALLVLVFCVLFLGQTVAAVARGYATDDTGVQTGMVVSLAPNDSTKVERATSESQNRIVGVVTTADDSSVAIASETSSVLVETQGEVDTYVTDINGAIEEGSLLTISPLKGVLMKAGAESGVIVGIALAGSSQSTDYTVDDRGSNIQAGISRVKVNLNRLGTEGAVGKQPTILGNIGKAITGKEVSEVRVVIALILFIIVLVAEGGIIYGAISSSITALGRNPLAHKLIRRELRVVILVALSVLGVGLGAVYGLLWV